MSRGLKGQRQQSSEAGKATGRAEGSAIQAHSTQRETQRELMTVRCEFSEKGRP